MTQRTLRCQTKVIMSRPQRALTEGMCKRWHLQEDHYPDAVLARTLGFLQNDGRIQLLLSQDLSEGESVVFVGC